MRATSPSVRLAEARGRAPLARLLRRAATRDTDLHDIASELGCSVTTVRHWVQDAGGYLAPIRKTVVRFPGLADPTVEPTPDMDSPA